MSPAAAIPSPHAPADARPLKSSTARFAAGFGLISAMSLVGISLEMWLLPSRVARIKLTNVLGHITGKAITHIAGATPVFKNREGIERAFPAIYVMNHTSTLDIFLAIWLCPIGGCGVTKKELKRVPFLGQLYQLSGHLMLDRGDRAKSVGALTEVAALMKKHRLGLWILPEGTRSHDGLLKPFKTGFVHLAIATGLPVVPVVVHGANRVWPKKGGLHAAKLPIEVLAPIDTKGWATETSRAHAQEVYEIMARALGQTPATTARGGEASAVQEA